MSPKMLYRKLSLMTSMRWNVLPWQIEIIICPVRLASDIRLAASTGANSKFRESCTAG